MWIHLDEEQLPAAVAALRAAGMTAAADGLQSRLDDERANADLYAQYRAAADDRYHSDGELEFDPEAVVSAGVDDGAYVMGWRWVTNAEAGVADEDEDAEDADAEDDEPGR